MMKKLFLVIAEWAESGDREELEFEVRTPEEAKVSARKELTRDYEPGWKIVAISEKMPEVSISSWA